MSKWANYFGQLRIYSLVDLWLLLAVAGATGRPLWGAVLLHIGFLAFLESQHQHKEREPVPQVLPWVLFMIGWGWFGPRIVGTWYMFFSVMYALKKQSLWGLASPFVRGAQTFVLLLPFTTNHPRLLLTASVAMIIRNFFGDLRDVEQDCREGLRTWPVVFGLRRDLVFMHLFGVLVTTWLWWGFSTLPIWIPVAINSIEIGTYWLTPRPNNEKAAAWLQSKILQLRR